MLSDNKSHIKSATNAIEATMNVFAMKRRRKMSF